MINFLVGSIPAGNPAAYCMTLNWIEDQGFIYVTSETIMTPAAGRIAGPGKPQFVPMILIYAKTTKEKFKKYYGIDYDPARVHQLPELLGKRERENFENKASHTGDR